MYWHRFFERSCPQCTRSPPHPHFSSTLTFQSTSTKTPTPWPFPPLLQIPAPHPTKYPSHTPPPTSVLTPNRAEASPPFLLHRSALFHSFVANAPHPSPNNDLSLLIQCHTSSQNHPTHWWALHGTLSGFLVLLQESRRWIQCSIDHLSCGWQVCL